MKPLKKRDTHWPFWLVVGDGQRGLVLASLRQLVRCLEADEMSLAVAQILETMLSDKK